MKTCQAAFGALLALVLHAGDVKAEYPDQTIRLVVPFAAGGATDVATRIHCRARTEARTCSFEDRTSLSEEATVL